jgi:hypothetical protein
MMNKLLERETASSSSTEVLRFDHVIDSRHKYISSPSRTVMVEHRSRMVKLAVPCACPACDFHVTSSVGDFLFLIGSQRPGVDGECYRGAMVVARRGADGVYATELWHETHLSFVMRVTTPL